MKSFVNVFRYAVVALLLVVGLSSCALLRKTPAVNTLSPKEQAAGWTLLFNGTDFTGWHGFNKNGIPAKWSIDDSAIHVNPSGDTEGGDVMTDATYENFELQLDWKIGECGNSGIMFHVAEDPKYNATYLTGPEMQVLDNTCHPDAKNGTDRLAGANYALHSPSPASAVKGAGKWNHVRLIVNGPHVEHWLNGKKVVSYELWSDEWKALVKASKFNEMPDYGMIKKGHIVLQDHGDAVWYRNIKIRSLDNPPA